MEDMIKEFLRCSIKNDFENFDFESFFDEFEPILQRKLTEHGLTSFEEFLEYQEEMGIYGDSDLAPFTIETDYVCYGVEEVKEAIIKGQYEACKDAFEGMFSELQELHEKLVSYSTELPLKEKIILFDECIHAEHVNGEILENLNESIEDMKKEIDQEYKDGLLTKQEV